MPLLELTTSKRGRPMRPLVLTPAPRQELLHLRDTDPIPYMRERAAALLQIADGHSAPQVARSAT